MNNAATDRSLREMVQEIKIQAGDFISTRVEMLKAEIREKVQHIKSAAPMMVAAFVFAWGAFLAFTFGLVALIAAFIKNPYGWAIAAGAVFLVYALAAALLGWLGYKEVQTEGLAPERTLRVLRQDQAWLKNEARSA
jgi:uncharacterized membrane protein YqjE